MSASRRRVTGITLPCAASFKNSSGVGEYMKSFLAEVRRKQKQEAAASDFSLQLYFCWVIVSQRMADIKTISARSLRREPVEERLSPGEAVRFSKRGGKKFE